MDLAAAQQRITALSEEKDHMKNIATLAGIAAIASMATFTVTSIVVAKAVLSYALVPMLVPLGALAFAICVALYYYWDLAVMLLGILFRLVMAYPISSFFVLVVVALWLRTIFTTGSST